MFLHAAKPGQKEVERLICWGCWGSMSGPNLEVGQSAMELVGYQTSCKEIWHICHSVYLLRRSPGLPPCGAQWRGRAICNILSSLTSQLHQQVYPAGTGEAQGPKDEWLPRLSRRELYEEALKAAHQRPVETAEVLRRDIERLSQGMRDVPQTHSRSCSRSCSRSHSRSHSRNCGRSCSKSHPQSCSLGGWPGSPSRSQSGRRVTFWEPEVELDPKGVEENYPPEPSILDIKTWLDWQACQLSTPCWWEELRAIPGVKDPWKLVCKIWASFSIPKIRSRAFQGQDYTVPPAPRCLNWNAFLLDELPYQDVQQQPFLLTVAYARGLQYWPEKLNLLESPDFCPLVGSVVELREVVREHIVFTNWDLLWDLGRVNLEAMNWWPQPSSSSRIVLPLGNEPSKLDTGFTEATTQTASLAASCIEPLRHITLPDGMEEENQYLLVITALIRQLNLGSASDNLRESSTAPPGGDTFQNPRMAAVLPGSTRAVSYQGATVKELEEWCGKQD